MSDYELLISCAGYSKLRDLPEDYEVAPPLTTTLEPDHDCVVSKADVIKMSRPVERYVRHLRKNPPNPVTRYTSETHSQEELWALVNGCRRR